MLPDGGGKGLSASFCSVLICVLKQCTCCIPTAEDDGYLVCYLMEEANGRTQLAVFDAKTMDSKPLATVEIPHRVCTRGSQSFPAASTSELYVNAVPLREGYILSRWLVTSRRYFRLQVPAGFHGLHIKEAELQTQAA